ncbi:MAG TPA: hypothetical protein VGD35_09045, partial [Chitinophaga sp.]
MSITSITNAKSFHTHFEREIPYYGVMNPVRTVEVKEIKHFIIKERELSYRFYPHFHPYVRPLMSRLFRQSVAGLQAADTEYVKKEDGSYELLPDGKRKPVLYADIFSSAAADPYAPSDMVRQPYPVKDLDFTYNGAYSVYNWEVFFHVPLTVAIQLSKNQRFADAQRWLHYIFDPTDNSDEPTPERF